MAVQGTWGIGDYKLPDLGITENFLPGAASSGKASWVNNPAVYQSFGQTPQGYAQVLGTNTQYQNYQQGQGLNPYGPTVTSGKGSSQSTGGGGGIGGGAGSGDIPGTNLFVGDIRGDKRWNGSSWEQVGGSNGGTDQYRQQQEGMIGSQFGEYFSNLDRQIGELPNEAALQSGKVENMATSQMGDINLGNQQTQQTIDTGVTNAQSNKATSLRDLESDMRSSLFAGNQYLGARGAGDSSAANMYSFALSKQANKAKSGVLDTFNKILAGLDQKKVELQNITNQEMTKLKTWKDNALIDVTNYISQKKDQLQSLISQGRIDQATAMRELNTNIYNQAQERLTAIDKQASAFSQTMSLWSTQRAAQLDDYKLKLTNQANFSIPDVINSEMMAYAPQAQTGGYSGVQQFGSIGQKKYDQWGNPIS